MNIYFAGSVRGGRQDVDLYQDIIKLLQNYGTVLTEHLGLASISADGEDLEDEFIYERDMAWLRDSSWIVAEITVTSHGVGYEIGYAHATGKNILCLYRPWMNSRPSVMIHGNKETPLGAYEKVEELKEIFDKYLK